MKKGAFDYITKPFKNDEVLVVLRNAVERRRLVAENVSLRQNLQARYQKFSDIIGTQSEDEAGLRPDHPGRAEPVHDPDHRRERHRQGAGRAGDPHQLGARATSRSSRSTPAPAARPARVELFGHVKGAFTGAVDPKKGLFELADKGSIFLDEIGNIPMETQAKLLRVMQEREFMRLGGMETIKVDVRIIAATNDDLQREMEDGRFREDLFYRLHVISIRLPPLRERKDDIPLLVQHFLEKYAEENGRKRSRSRPRRSTC